MTASTEELVHPTLCPRHPGGLEPRDLVAGLWIEWFDATPTGGSSPQVRNYGRRYVVRPPHWTKSEDLVVALLQTPDYKTDHEIATVVFTPEEVRVTSLSGLGMVPDATGRWRDSWVIRSEDQRSRKKTT